MNKELNERYFGLDVNETPTQAAARQAQQIRKAPSKPSIIEQLMDERAKQAVEEVRGQVKTVITTYEEQMKILADALNKALDFIKDVSKGNANRSDAVIFLEKETKGK